MDKVEKIKREHVDVGRWIGVKVLRMTKQMKIEENRLGVKAQLWGKGFNI